MKIFSATQIREWDQFTIQQEPIDAVDLMERAAAKCTEWVLQNIAGEKELIILCGKGNNGGDGLAMARGLFQQNRSVKVCVLEGYSAASPDFSINFQRLQQLDVEIKTIRNKEDIPQPGKNAVLIDALFGSGLNRPLDGLAADLVNAANQSGNMIISIDMPSGLFADKSSMGYDVVQADYTLSFQNHKLAFLLPENEKFTGQAVILDIGLHVQFEQKTESRFELIEAAQIKALLKPRKKFSHKGSFGHAAIFTGSYGIMGAAILAAKACLRSGAGKVAVHIPKCGVDILQVAVPEAICHPDSVVSHLKHLPELGAYDAVAIGPGIGLHKDTIGLLEQLLTHSKKAILTDADALNILALYPELLHKIPAHSILTPHPKEFERLFGASQNDFERIELALTKAQQHNLYLLLKGHFSFLACPDGRGYFNSTGNAGMATAGSGDVLTGIINGLLAQGYAPPQAALIGMYWHGLAGDLAAEKNAQPPLIAGDIVAEMGRAFLEMMY